MLSRTDIYDRSKLRINSIITIKTTNYVFPGQASLSKVYYFRSEYEPVHVM